MGRTKCVGRRTKRLGDKGEGACWGAVGARLKEENEASETTAEAWKNRPSDPAGVGFTF